MLKLIQNFLDVNYIFNVQIIPTINTKVKHFSKRHYCKSAIYRTKSRKFALNQTKLILSNERMSAPISCFCSKLDVLKTKNGNIRNLIPKLIKVTKTHAYAR